MLVLRAVEKLYAKLRDRPGEGFVGGVVLRTGPRPYLIDDRIIAAPISTLWAWTEGSSPQLGTCILPSDDSHHGPRRR